MRSLFLIGFILTAFIQKSIGCDVCKKNQPEVLKDITHGTGPQGNSDYFLIWGAVIIVAISLFLSVKYLIRPGEDNPSHIKNIILTGNNDSDGN